MISRNVKFLSLVLFILSSASLFGVQEIKEVTLISKILRENADSCHKILKLAYFMREQAVPFSDPRYQSRFRFKPREDHAREILSITRTVRSKFKMLSGIIYHVPIKNREVLFTAVYTSLDNLTTAAKRALRAIKDGNSALYMVSAQTSDREAKNIYKLIGDLEDLINKSIEQSDRTLHEDL